MALQNLFTAKKITCFRDAMHLIIWLDVLPGSDLWQDTEADAETGVKLTSSQLMSY